MSQPRRVDHRDAGIDPAPVQGDPDRPREVRLPRLRDDYAAVGAVPRRAAQLSAINQFEHAVECWQGTATTNTAMLKAMVDGSGQTLTIRNHELLGCCSLANAWLRTKSQYPAGQSIFGQGHFWHGL